MQDNKEEAPTPKKSNVTVAAGGFAHVTTTGSHSPQDNSSTTVDSGKINVTSWSGKRTPNYQSHEQYMTQRLREEEEAIRVRQSKMSSSSSKEDLVHKPSHYNQAGIECIEAIRASLGGEGFRDYCQGNVMKYLWRYKYKNGLQDLEKCQVYLGWLIESYED